MKKFDIRICKTETVQLNKPEIFLNFCGEDTAFSTPIYDLIIGESMDCVCDSGNCNNSILNNCEMIINIVTDKFSENDRCLELLRAASNSGIRVISLMFTDEVNITENLGERIVVNDVYEDIEEYLLTSLYSVESIKSYVGVVEDEFSLKVRRILHGSIIPPNLKIGGEEVIILAVGSMGYSTIKAWMQQGFELGGKVVIVERNKYVTVGQPLIDPSIPKWVIGCEKHENENGNDFINAFNREIREWLRNNAVGRKVILLGGLGKSSASLLLPYILIEAKKLKIDTCVACTLPMGFEGKKKTELAQRSLAVLKEVSSSLYYHDNNAMEEYFSDRHTPLKDNFNLVSYSIAIALNDWCGNYERKGVNKILISKKDGNRTIEKQIGTYGWFEISIGGI